MRRFAVHGDLGRTILVNTHTGIKERNPAILFLFRSEQQVLSKTKVLSTEVNTFKRRIKEAIQIKLTKPALNRDNGYELAAIYDTILTPKRR